MKIIMACGGTGGHIFPAVSVSEELRNRRPPVDTLYVCGKKDIETAIFSMVKGEKVVSIESAPFRGAASALHPTFIWKLLSGFSQAWKLLRREKPDAVVGFGGHYSFPVLLAAKCMGIPTLLHEQNVVPGMANKWLCRISDGVALSFEETRPLLSSKKCRVTGNPIRASIERDCRQEALSHFGFSAEKKTLLILGGSQGAESINTLYFEALGRLGDAFKRGIQVLHLCGRMSATDAEERSRQGDVDARAFSFFERMDLAYGAADFCLGRAGATFLAEIAVKGIPAILIPYPFGDGHQFRNAEAFGRTHGATVLKQGELTGAELARQLEALWTDLGRARAVETPHGWQPRNARRSLAEYIVETAGAT